MDSLKHENHADVIEVFNSTSWYLDDLLNIDNPYFEGMVNQNYPPGLQFVTEPYVPYTILIQIHKLSGMLRFFC